MKHRLAACVTAMLTCLTVAASAGTAAASAEPNDADVEFARMMIPHHYQALVMTRLVPERSSDGEVRALAERINVAQDVEIGAMRGWQGRSGLPVTDAEKAYEGMLDDPELLEQMGMATPAELEELKAARGNEFDVQFLQLMIPHHEGAIRMAEHVVANGRDIPLRQMATDMIGTQSAQIDTMREMLERK